MAGYGTIANVKVNYLRISDTADDTQLTAILDDTARLMDDLFRPWLTVPLTGDDVTESVKKINEMWTAGTFRLSSGPSQLDIQAGERQIEQAKTACKEHVASFKEHPTPFVIRAKKYGTAPLNEDTSETSLVT